MVIKPNECVEGNSSFESALKQYEDQIDAQLKSRWYAGCPGINIGQPKINIFDHSPIVVQSKIIERYSAAGWDLKFETSSDPRDNASESWISVRLKK